MKQITIYEFLKKNEGVIKDGYDDATSIKQMIETDKYNWREQGMTMREVKERTVKKQHSAWICTGSQKYYHEYSLLHRFVDRGR